MVKVTVLKPGCDICMTIQIFSWSVCEEYKLIHINLLRLP